MNGTDGNAAANRIGEAHRWLAVAEEDMRDGEAHRWLAVAEEDMRVAQVCIDVADPAVSSGAFHCQQAAEKIVKGLLVAAGIPFRKTHDMDELSDLAVPAYPDLAPLFDAVRRLTVWGVAFRYPSLEDAVEPVPDVPELKAALQVIGRLAHALRALRPGAAAGGEA